MERPRLPLWSRLNLGVERTSPRHQRASREHFPIRQLKDDKALVRSSVTWTHGDPAPLAQMTGDKSHTRPPIHSLFHLRRLCGRVVPKKQRESDGHRRSPRLVEKPSMRRSTDASPNRRPPFDCPALASDQGKQAKGQETPPRRFSFQMGRRLRPLFSLLAAAADPDPDPDRARSPIWNPSSPNPRWLDGSLRPFPRPPAWGTTHLR
jgi:hypothetical protein